MLSLCAGRGSCGPRFIGNVGLIERDSFLIEVSEAKGSGDFGCLGSMMDGSVDSLDVASADGARDSRGKTGGGLDSGSLSSESDVGLIRRFMDCVPAMIRASVKLAAIRRDRYRLCNKDLQMKISDF